MPLGTVLVVIGDKLVLCKVMAGDGSLNSADLTKKTGTNVRYRGRLGPSIYSRYISVL